MASLRRIGEVMRDEMGKISMARIPISPSVFRGASFRLLRNSMYGYRPTPMPWRKSTGNFSRHV